MIAEHEYAVVLRAGEQLVRRAVSCPSGEYGVVHQHDGNVVVYRNADHCAVWATGTDFQPSVYGSEALEHHDLDRAFGRPGRLVLQEDGNLVVYSSTGQPLWASGTTGRSTVALMIQDSGRLVLRTAEDTIAWASPYAPLRWDGWNRVTDGRRLRRGQCLRGGSLVSDNGAYAFVVEGGGAACLCRTAGRILWTVGLRPQEGYALTGDGRLVTRGPGGEERPAQSLGISDSAAAALAQRGAAEMSVTDDGRLVITDGDGTVLWSMTPAFTHTPRQRLPRAERPKARPAPDVPLLPAGEELPVIRTDFSDDAAWEDAVARVSAEYDDDGDTWSVDVTPIDDRRYAGLTSDQLALLVPESVHWPMFVVADARTMASSGRDMLMVTTDPEALVDSARATPTAIVEIAINLWIANMDWEDYVGEADGPAQADDRVLEAWNIEEPPE
ncbi:DUF6924 domain-containing protein [Streptomyces minutiscleroticus]|uniref:DUF6924 domain-containing protein n=1 Tax=Streptomyces minutiscleroticus TaxID=68238 RepID=UPI000A7B0405|nr:hypothetical protein [Streptomyces minutiscleroticus]